MLSASRGHDTRKDWFLMQSHSTRTPSFPANLEDYAPWVSIHGLTAPYGQCQCTCGQTVPLSTFTKKSMGLVKGEPIRFLHSHWHHSLTLEDAFWKYVDPGDENECWEWQKVLTVWGYGVVCFHHKRYAAHRVSFELHYGPIPAGLQALHKCDNPPCCNPNHLFLGTDADNVADKVSKGRQARGVHAPSAKLTEADVIAIRTLGNSGMQTREIARQYGRSESTIGRIVRGQGWTHLT